MTVEEKLEALKETVTIQLDCIIFQRSQLDNLDRKVDDLERALGDEQAANKVLMKFLKDKFGPGFIERVESNLQ